MPLPKRIFAHGWLLFENDKMSKSRGNIVRAEPIRQVMGADALRYFLLREIVFGQDGSFSYDALVGRYNSDLANGLGNLASRTLTMIHQYRGGAIPGGQRSGDRGARQRDHRSRRRSASTRFEFSKGLEAVWALISRGGQVHRAAGALEAGATDRSRRRRPSSSDDALHRRRGLRIATALLYPVLPQSAPKIWAQLGMPEPIEAVRFDDAAMGQLQPGQKIGEIAGVFPRIEAEGSDREDARAGRSRSRPNRTCCSARSRRPPAAAAPATPKIAIDDFVKVDLRVGLVLSAERVKGSDKLLHMKVDIGEAEPRTIVAGIAEAYTPEQLVGPQGGDRREPAAAQAEGHRIERHDRGGLGRRRQAGAGRLPRGHPGRSAPEVSAGRFALPPGRREVRRRPRAGDRARARGRRRDA